MSAPSFGLALACVGANAQEAASGAQYAAGRPSETKDRLSNDALRELVKRPLEDFMSGDTPGGERDFEAQFEDCVRARGPSSVEAADLLSGMGVSLYIAASDADNEILKRESLIYLRRAIDAKKAAFGPDHPEVALSLNDYAMVEINLDPANPAADTEATLREAYRIRLASLGPLNGETVNALALLAQVMGLPSRTGGDPAKIADAASMFEQAIAGMNSNTEHVPSELAMLYYDFAEFWVRNHNVESGKTYFSRAEDQYEAIGPDLPEGAFAALRFASVLKSSGYADEAKAVRDRYATRIADMIARAKSAP